MNEQENLSIIVSEVDNRPKTDKQDIVLNYRKQMTFIKEALSMGDKELNGKKVTEIPTLMKKAREEITIGSFGKLLKNEQIKVGLIELAAHKIKNAFSNNRRRNY
jgi:hypothetical protein